MLLHYMLKPRKNKHSQKRLPCKERQTQKELLTPRKKWKKMLERKLLMQRELLKKLKPKLKQQLRERKQNKLE